MTELARDLLEQLRRRGELGSAMRAHQVDMPDVSTIIQWATHPPLGSLHSHLDVSGPFAEGDHLRSIWTKGTDELLSPAGVYMVQNTFGVIAQVVGLIPPGWGYDIGWRSALGLQDGDRYHNRFVQIVVQHDLGAISPGHTPDYITSDIFEQHHLAETWFWREANPSYIALHVEPGISIDLYYLTTS